METVDCFFNCWLENILWDFVLDMYMYTLYIQKEQTAGTKNDHTTQKSTGHCNIFNFAVLGFPYGFFFICPKEFRTYCVIPPGVRPSVRPSVSNLVSGA
jgi:hypothetical protein